MCDRPGRSVVDDLGALWHELGDDDRRAAVFGSLVGARMPGGCDYCDAYLMVKPIAGYWLVGVFHPDGCRRPRPAPCSKEGTR